MHPVRKPWVSWWEGERGGALAPFPQFRTLAPGMVPLKMGLSLSNDVFKEPTYDRASCWLTRAWHVTSIAPNSQIGTWGKRSFGKVLALRVWGVWLNNQNPPEKSGLGDWPSQSYYFCVKIPWKKSKLGRKGFIWLSLLHCSLSLKEARAGSHTGQEPGGRSWCRVHGGMVLTGLLPMALSAWFLIESRTTDPGMASLPPQCDGISPVNH